VRPETPSPYPRTLPPRSARLTPQRGRGVLGCTRTPDYTESTLARATPTPAHSDNFVSGRPPHHALSPSRGRGGRGPGIVHSRTEGPGLSSSVPNGTRATQKGWRYGVREVALAALIGRVASVPRSDRPVTRAPGSDCPLPHGRGSDGSCRFRSTLGLAPRLRLGFGSRRRRGSEATGRRR